MDREIPPRWSEEERAAGERSEEVWEEFFAARENDPRSHVRPPLGRDEEQKVNEVRARYEEELLRYPNVVGVMTGIRMKRGKPTGEPCIIVYVERKLPKESLGSEELLPTEIEGIPVDVVPTGPIEPLPA